MKGRFKTKNICIRVSEEEYNIITQYAAKFKLPTGMYMRLIALLGYLPYEVDVAIRANPTVAGVRKVTDVREKIEEPQKAVGRSARRVRAG